MFSDKFGEVIEVIEENSFHTNGLYSCKVLYSLQNA